MSMRDELLELLSYLPTHREVDTADLGEIADSIIEAGWSDTYALDAHEKHIIERTIAETTAKLRKKLGLT